MGEKATKAVDRMGGIESALQSITVAVDAMGGDHAPQVVLEGVRQALDADAQLSIILTGNAESIEAFSKEEQLSGRVEAVAASEFIDMDEHPALAVRRKKDSSVVVGCQLVNDGRAKAFFSAGSTGASMAAAIMYIGRIKGVHRPAIASVIPSPDGPVILTDIGANADVKAKYLLQFAQMAGIYAERILNVENPRIGLLNIGEEETKGTEIVQEAYRLMKEKLPGFCGNAEGNDILSGRFDVIVTDGFTGNITLKTIEGTASALFDQLKEILMSSIARKIAASVIMPGLKGLKKSLSADEVGGAPLLGLKGTCIIGHGSSNAKAIANGIAVAATCVRERVPEIIAEAVE